MADTGTALQEYLSSLSQLPGSLLYRDLKEWKALAPGSEGQALKIGGDKVPYWDDVASGIPPFMLFGNSGSWFEGTPGNLTNNPYTFIAAFNCDVQTQLGVMLHVRHFGPWVFLIAVTTAGTVQAYVWDASSNLACQLSSINSFDDQATHALFFTYDPAAGAASLIIDGNNEDDTGWGSRILTTATLRSGFNATYRVGGDNFTPRLFAGYLSHLGFSQEPGLAYSDFFDASNRPKALDVTTWTEWKTQPELYQESAKMDQNLGVVGRLPMTGNIDLQLSSVTL